MAVVATSRFLRTTQAALPHLRRRAVSTVFPIFTRTFTPTTVVAAAAAPFLRTTRNCSTSIAADGLEAHPWSEWEGFVEKLRGKGYFEKTDPMGEGESEEGRGGGREVRISSPSYYTRVKAACIGFARDRPDILRSLPKEDIRAVIKCGCPNLLRKTVNSAKRLREYLRIDEGDVCSSCNLRGTCDRAYVMPKGEAARTVDLVRILLQFAASPLAVDLGEKPQPKEYVEESVRKLLLELIKLSDTVPNPEYVKATVKPQMKREVRQVMKAQETKLQTSTEMKRGDWICTVCNYMNYARNLRCLQCNADGPKRVSFDSPEMKRGDWTCPRCKFMNFARNTECRQCQESRPKRELLPGEWDCPKCGFLNFRRNRTCPKCNCDRPSDESSRNEDHIWKRPRPPRSTGDRELV